MRLRIWLELEHSIEDLVEYMPFMRSVSIVPAGITKYREGLFPLELFDAKESASVIDLIERKQQECYKKYGLHFVHASDEWYITAGRPFPEEERYDGYIQLENGVGMMRLFIDEFNTALNDVKSRIATCEVDRKFKRTLTVITGKLAYNTICGFAEEIGRASCRERVCQYVHSRGLAGSM